MDETTEFLIRASAWVLPTILAITFHEAAHGWAASKLGDDTAKRLGRVTFNPIAHVDPFGTVILPALLYFTTGFLFGWAKPVPVSFGRLNKPRRDMVLVALAGPVTNILLAFVSAWLMRWAHLLPEPLAPWAATSLQISVVINLVLAIFNMLPLPPLDGGRVAVGILPRPLAIPLARMERYGLLVLIGVLVLLPMIGGQLGYRIEILPWLLRTPMEYIGDLIFRLAGHG
ncbi:site-2 protease family protein [Arenibaculum sp.]|jgi:Zn-dependent protease|uniref:site-2 protease family protein n=1 Tax=Arenibaculum sp. TaxID=2865862 RepID=UPI002E12D96F|nr:site-2 protease family protein [Arenibaculum sp.]